VVAVAVAVAVVLMGFDEKSEENIGGVAILL
jgi:hypothetical protein